MYSAALRDTRWGYLLTLWLLVSLTALVVMLLRCKEGWWHPEEGIDQRGLRGNWGAIHSFVAVSDSMISISNTAGLYSSGHAELSLLAVKHSSASCGTGWPWFFLCTGRKKGQTSLWERENQNHGNVTIVGLKHCWCRCHWCVFEGKKGHEATFCIPFLYTYLVCQINLSKEGDSFPDSEVLAAHGVWPRVVKEYRRTHSWSVV